MARELGVDQFRVVLPWGVAWDDPDIRPAPVNARVRRLNWLSATNLPQNWNPFPKNIEADTIQQAFENPWDRRLLRDETPSKGHTCKWLYNNIVMDAGGRIMPCCGAPARIPTWCSRRSPLTTLTLTIRPCIRKPGVRFQRPLPLPPAALIASSAPGITMP